MYHFVKRIVDGLLQAFAVRAAGFATVTLSDVAPALQLLYVVMMYIAVYPIAVSIRSTNVYEEKVRPPKPNPRLDEGVLTYSPDAVDGSL